MRVVLLLSTLLALSNAKTGFGTGEQDWGHETVRPGAHIFWWLHYTTATVYPDERPLIIWLQGGPGASSTGYGNFLEIGPKDVDCNDRNSTWVKDANILFVDSPVGTGFSYLTGFVKKYATTNQQVALDLVELLRGFYAKVPGLANVPLYIAGESYGAKVAVEFAQKLLLSTVNADLRGLLLSNPWISPVDSILSWAPYMQNFAVIDPVGYSKINYKAQVTKTLVDLNQFGAATIAYAATQRVALAASDHINFFNILKKVTKLDVLRSTVNLRPIKPSVDHDAEIKLKAVMDLVSSALGLNRVWNQYGDEVFLALKNDFMKPVTSIVEYLLTNEEVKIFVMNGQLDVICNTAGTLQWVDRLDWTQSEAYANGTETPRNLVVIDNVNVGYEKVHEKFGMFWINRAGHMIPADNPVGSAYVLNMLTNNFEV